MYIYKIIIKNFRNLREFSWKPNKHINVLFGQNGCGKTTVAEALSLLFTHNRFKTFFDKTDHFLGDSSNKIIIQAWLADIDTYSSELSLNIQHINENDEAVTDDTEENTKQVLILQLESSEDDKMEWSFVVSTGVRPCSIKDRSSIDYNYIDTKRNPLKEVGLQENSVLYQLAKEHIADELNSIAKDVVAYANKRLLESSVLDQYLETLHQLGKLDVIEKFSILLKNPESSWNSSGYELGTTTGNAQLSFDMHSSGIQSLFLLLLMKEKLEGSGIVFIEELEQSLEPKNQRYIADEYRKLKAGQIFISSHSIDIISHFNYENIFIMLETGAKQLLEGQSQTFLKEVTRNNRKDFIASLMCKKILLVEGETELGAFPVYSFNHNLSLSYLDVEILRVGGKGNFRIYAEAYKKLGKQVYVLLDHDSDIASTINSIKDISDCIILAANDYEEMILPYISKCADELCGLVDFQVVKNKLIAIQQKAHDKCTNKKEKALNQSLTGSEAKLAAMQSYSDLLDQPDWLSYILHDSFATTYLATAVASIICEKCGTPAFFNDIVNCIKGNCSNLDLYEQNRQIWKIRGGQHPNV